MGKICYTASDAYALFDPADIEAANDILYSQKVTGKQKQRLDILPSEKQEATGTL